MNTVKLQMKNIFLSLLFIPLLGLVACSGDNINKDDPKELYQDAEADIENDRYLLALEKLRIVKNKFPYSKYSTDAQLKIADVYFLQESYAEAAANYETFAELHPKNERVSYAAFRIAESHQNDIPGTIARDLTPAKKAAEAYRVFISKYPNDASVQKAKDNLAKVTDVLAKKQLYIGDYYFRQDEFEPAEDRYQKLISVYPDSEPASLARPKLEKAKSELEGKTPEKLEINGAYKYRRYRDLNR